MNKTNRLNKKASWSPPTLLDHFKPPSGYAGHFGVVCGYSADAVFMNQALELFTGQNDHSRASAGESMLALMLDPGAPHLTTADVPGLWHALLLDEKNKPFRLLHAKVALLGFRNADSEDAKGWCVRLVVSTGNWTSQTLLDSLDLAWVIEQGLDSLQDDSEDCMQDRVDLVAAHAMLDRLRACFDFRLFEEGSNARQSKARLDDLDACLTALRDKIPTRRKPAPRFIDNWDDAFLKQLPARIEACCGGDGAKLPNALFLGSGFFEGGKDAKRAPIVLDKIVDLLLKKGLLDQQLSNDGYSPRGVHIVVNPQACQAVATSAQAILDNGWMIRPPSRQLSLHAKFLFSAHYRRNQTACTSAWVYLGSANLTKPGFTTAAEPKGNIKDRGNIEAGVVFAPADLDWSSANKESRAVQNLLPIQWETSVSAEGLELNAGDPMPEPPKPIVASPFGWMRWEPAKEGPSRLIASGDAAASSGVEVLDPSGRPCERLDDGAFQWTGSAPRQVMVRWQDGNTTRSAFVPIVDGFGRIAPTELRALLLDEAMTQLLAFPAVAEDDDDQDRDAAGLSGTGNGRGNGDSAAHSSYPVRTLMELVEQIAAKQTRIAQRDWLAWCARLEQYLTQASGSAVVEQAQRWRLNPLSPLRHAPFLPSFAEPDTCSDKWQTYSRALDRIESEWNVAHLCKLEALE